MALPEVSEPPELIGPLVGVANPEGKSDSGNSTDSSCVPVSCPDAGGSGVVDADGAAPEDAAPDAVAVSAPLAVLVGAEVLAEGDGAAVEAAELLEEEHPAAVANTPAAAASTTTDGRTLRTAIDDTVVPTSDLDPDPDNVPVPHAGSVCRPAVPAASAVRNKGAVRNTVPFGIMSQEHQRPVTYAGLRKG